MNQIAFLDRSAGRRALADPTAQRCDLTMLCNIAITTMKPVLQRRSQIVTIEPAGRPAIVRGDLSLVFTLISAVVLEAAGLSSARARLRVAFDIDEGDAVVTIIGANSNHLPAGLMRLDRELSELASESGAELEQLWDEQEGPTLVLRFFNCEAMARQ